jgi:hypothetical protein
VRVFITAVPSTKLFARGGGGMEDMCYERLRAEADVMMMSFICSLQKQKIGAELHTYLEEGTYHTRLFRGPNTNDMKK